MAIYSQRLTIYLYSAHRAVIFAIAQLSCFWLRLSAKWGYFTPKHISSSRAHSNKIPTKSPCFRGQTFNGATSDIRQLKSKTVTKKKCIHFTAVLLTEDIF